MQIAVSVNREALAEFVRQQMKLGERDWSTHEVARRARGGGYTLSNGTVQRVLNLNYKKDLNEDTLRALAYVFGVPPAQVFAVYHGTTDEDEKTIRNQRLAALAVDAEKLSPEDIPKFEALMEYVQTTVRQMIKDRSNAAPRGKDKAAKSRVG